MLWLESLQQHPVLLYVLTFIITLCVGSFLNVVITRLPIMLDRNWRSECKEYLEQEPDPESKTFNLFTPRSCCPQCQSPIKSLQNIPVLSYLFLKGRCAGCKKSISCIYPLVELLFALTCVWILYASPTTGILNIVSLGAMVYAAFLFCLFFIDLKTMLLPDELTVPLIWIGLLFNLSGTFATIQSAIIGAVAGYLILWIIFWGFKLLTGKEGLGYGDFKLLAAIGAWIGWQALPFILLISAVLTLILVMALKVTGNKHFDQQFPFGPGLAVAGLIGIMQGWSFIPFFSQILH